MGLADTVTKAYMKENTVFADAFNYLIYGGKTVVNPTQLKELDTTEKLCRLVRRTRMKISRMMRCKNTVMC